MDVASPKERFDAAVKVIHSLPKNGSFQPSHAMMLTFYGLYKQALNGPCNVGKPYVWDVVGRAKWEAWNKLGDMPQERAMLLYVEELKKIIETMPHTDNVEEFIETLGNFYELIDDGTNSPLSAVIRRASPRRSASPVAVDSNAGLVNGKHATADNGGFHAGDSSPSSVESSPSHSPLRNGGDRNGDCTGLNGDVSHHNMAVEQQQQLKVNGGDDDVVCEVAASVVLERQRQQSTAVVPVKVKSLSSSRFPESDAVSSDDGDEFCDTSDIAAIPNGNGTVHESRPVERFEGLVPDGDLNDALVSRGGGEFPPSQQRTSLMPASGTAAGAQPSGLQLSPTMGADSVVAPTGGSGAGGSGGGGGPVYGLPVHVGSASAGTVEQIAVALVRLQQDMNSAIVRLQTLETLTLAQQQLANVRSRSESDSETHSSSSRRRSQPSWLRPFAGFRTSTVFFLLTWPFVVHLLIRLFSGRRRRLNQ